MRLPADPGEEAIAARLRHIREEIGECACKSGRAPEDIRLLAVTKTVPPERVNFVLDNGVEWLGENRVQEYLDKRPVYHTDGEHVHFIGHLQTNKVKYIIDKVGMIQSVGSLKLAGEIDRRAAGLGRVMEILLEANMAGESSKSGFSPQELRERLGELASLEHIRIRGMMCIPERGRGGYWFQKAGELFRALKDSGVPGTRLDWLSMGMSADYGQAILCGANMVRIGSALFGERG